MNRLAAAGAALVSGEVERADAIHGGDLSQVVRVALTDGRYIIVKNGPAPSTEAGMLRAMAAAGAPVPSVLAVSDTALVLEAVPNGGGSAWSDLGKVLATLHRASSDHYGWPENYAFGTVSIENAWTLSWPEFWADGRLRPNLKFIPAALGHRIEALAVDLVNRLPATPSPALLHGDLWSGNLLTDGGRVSALIDPACYYGHGEVDIAMLGLFGRIGLGFHEAYGMLEAGWRERLPIYRLWPALVHLRLFGDGYRPMVETYLHDIGF